MRPPTRVVTLDALGADTIESWDRLVTRTGAGYFTAPVWASSWYDCFGDGAATQVGLWTHGDRLDGLAAVGRSREPLGPGRLGERFALPRWQILGSGPGGADHLGFPCADELRSDVLEWVLGRGGAVRLDSLDRSWAAELRSAGMVDPHPTRTYRTSLVGSPRPGSKKLWKHIARSRRQLLERGVEFDQLSGRDIDREALSALFSLHGARSDRAGRSTTFTAARLEFHTHLAQRSTDVHRSFLVRARCGGELVGALYGFMDASAWHYYQSGWDPAFEKASLGSVLIGDAIDLAAEHGAITFDFLRGDEPYKLRFGAECVEDVSSLCGRGATRLALSIKDRAVEYQARRHDGRPQESATSGEPARGASAEPEQPGVQP